MSEPMNPELGGVSARISRLSQVVNDQTRSTHKKQKTYMVVGGCVILCCFVFLFSLTAKASKLDADSLTQIARLQVEQQLPEGRKEIVMYLENEAPQLVSRVLASFLNLVPELRSHLVAGMTEKMTVINNEIEQRFEEQFVRSMQATKSDIDRAFPNATEAEKLEKLVEKVADDFNKGIEVAMGEMYPEYSAEMNRIHSYLVDLEQKDPTEMTVRERTHKEIIETMLRLMLRQKEMNSGKPALETVFKK